MYINTELAHYTITYHYHHQPVITKLIRVASEAADVAALLEADLRASIATMAAMFTLPTGVSSLSCCEVKWHLLGIAGSNHVQWSLGLKRGKGLYGDIN